VKRHVVVVGAGIVGACCAGWLQRKGFDVTLIERDRPGRRPRSAMPVRFFGGHIAGGHARYASRHSRLAADPLGPLTVRWSYGRGRCPAAALLLRASTKSMWHTGNSMRPLLRICMPAMSLW
jgi:D-amino-acid dehydrogenase